MKTFTAGLAAALAKKTGAAPLWILKLTVAGVTYYLSDQESTIAGWSGGVSTLPWVAAWGELREELVGSLTEIRIADMTIGLLVDIDASPNAADLALDDSLEASPCSLYLWEQSCDPATDPPAEIARFYVTEVNLPTPAQVELTLEDEMSRLRQPVGEIVTAENWPDADPDDIGRIVPIPFGAVTGLPPVALSAGIITTLAADMTAGQTTMTVAEPRGVTAGKQFAIGTERVYVASISGSVATVTRGYGGTTAAAHTAGAQVTEYRTAPFAFAASDRAVTSLDKILCRRGGLDYDVTDLCSRYTGQAGSQYSGYGSRAVVVISQAQAEAIRARCVPPVEVTDPGHEHTSSLMSTAVKLEDVVIDSGGTTYFKNDKSKIIDLDFGTGTTWGSYTGGNDNCKVYRRTPFKLSGNPTRVRLGVKGGDATSYLSGTAQLYLSGVAQPGAVTVGGSAETTRYSSWYTLADWAALSAADTYVRLTAPPISAATAYGMIFEVYLEVEYDPTTSTGATGLTVSGNSVADKAIGGRILVNLTAPDSAPADAMGVILSRVGVATAVSTSGTLPAGYSFDGAIIKQETADKILHRMALQCRSWFRMAAGTPRLVVRPDTPTGGNTLAAVAIDDVGNRLHSRRKGDMAEIINTLNVRYDRDWTKEPDAGAYRSVVFGTNASSVATYGARSRDDLFMLDLVASTTMAESLRDFYLSAYALRSWRHGLDLFLDNIGLEFGDVVALQFSAGETGEIVSAGIAPGGASSIDRARLTVRA